MHSQLCGFDTIQFVQDFVENLWLQQLAAPVACISFVVRAEDFTRFSFLQGFGSCVQISRFFLVELLRGKSILFGVCSSFFFPFFWGGLRSFSSSSSDQYIRYRNVGAAGFSVFLRELLCCVRVCVCVCLSRESLICGIRKGKVLSTLGAAGSSQSGSCFLLLLLRLLSRDSQCFFRALISSRVG